MVGSLPINEPRDHPRPVSPDLRGLPEAPRLGDPLLPERRDSARAWIPRPTVSSRLSPSVSARDSVTTLAAPSTPSWRSERLRQIVSSGDGSSPLSQPQTGSVVRRSTGPADATPGSSSSLTGEVRPQPSSAARDASLLLRPICPAASTPTSLTGDRILPMTTADRDPFRRRSSLRRLTPLRARTPWRPERQPLRRRSRRMETIYRERRTLVARILDERRICEARWDDRCQMASVDVHEILPRSQGGRIIGGADSEYLAVCRWCHDQIETHPAEAHERGFRRWSWESSP